MIWTEKPYSNDPLAKTRARVHNTFGGKVVEIIYGAKDADGNAVMPQEDADDGHGRWYGIEVDGKYCMFSWKHSAEEGGALEYGTDKNENAVAVMEDEIIQKKALARRAEIASEDPSDEAKAELEAVRSEWNALTDWETPREAEYLKRIEKAESRFAEQFEVVEKNKAAMLEVLKKAEELENEPNFKKAREGFRNLRKELNDLDSAGEKNDREIYSKLREMEDAMRARERDYFANRDANRDASAVRKKELIERAEEILKNTENFKAAGDKLNNLFNDWKAAGSAGRDADDELWEKFNGIRKQFYEKKNAFFAERNAKWNESVEAKKALIEEAKKIAEGTDFSKAVTDTMKSLDVKWKAAGYSGKELNDKLWEEFSKIKETFWDAKKERAVARFRAQLDEKTKLLDSTKKNLDDLQYRLTLELKNTLKEDIERRIYLEKAAVENLEKEIAELKERIEK
ncbi:MAG: DUF349 domain-containing protein [Solobacterium sp.]|nr:DUF349 domain-containing protein [Solobacterium sp.]